ncbi:NmrA family NAD(P)-binding protein [Mycobacterium sp. UM_CSW]|uniref:NmrA family NAD(P)-binding protein n=1 Tax=Mycobacterium sp. UM_CSW TaxID=1370119 RepID=UPI0004152680|nr:NmrA family NAD(P)-binding protein [Mycobacterium sp. UM_CSW]
MPSEATTVFDGPVTAIGATGQQGGAVVDALVNQAVPVRAATRNPNGGKARALAQRGIEVVYADPEDERSMRAAFAGAAAAFAMTTHDGPDGPAREVAQGRVIAAAAAAARLPFLLYSSVGGVDRGSGVPHFESKQVIEELLRQAVPVTFVRPTFFMETLRLMIRCDGDRIELAMPLPEDIAVQLISVRDIGRAAAALLLNGDPLAAPVEIAGDELTGEQIAQRISHASGSPASYVSLPPDALGDDEDLKAMFRWLAQLPAYQADFARTRELVPDVEDVRRWLARTDGRG